jgi:hypothetical protein
MPGKRIGRKGTRKGRSSSGKATIALSMSDMRERQLATRTDRIIISGKTAFSVLEPATGASNTAINPSFFGDRVNRHSLLYARWKVIKMIVQNAPANQTGSNTAQAYGVVDDYSFEGSTAPLPSTVNEVVELRCSRANLSVVNPSELEWKPLDPMKLYYTQSGNSSTDPRLVIPGTFATASGGNAVTANFVVYYTLQFEGAFDNTA